MSVLVVKVVHQCLHSPIDLPLVRRIASTIGWSAVNVTEVPLHIVVEEAAMLTLGSTLVDVIVTGLLVAVGVEAQAGRWLGSQ
jgi:hypothetical protein